MKKLIFILFVFLSLFSVKAQLPKISVDGIFYNVTSLENQTVEVTSPESNNVYIGQIDIPSKITFKNRMFFVKGIGYRAFYRSRVTKVNIAEGIEYIGEQAFLDANMLRDITLPYSLKKVFFSGLAVNVLNELILHESLTRCDFNGVIRGTLKIEDSNTPIYVNWLNASTVYIGRNFAYDHKIHIMAKEIIISENVNASTLYRILDGYSEGEFDLQRYKYEKPSLRRYYDNIKGERKIVLKHKEPLSVGKFNDRMSDLYINVTLYVPKESLDKYKQHYIWGKFFEIRGF